MDLENSLDVKFMELAIEKARENLIDLNGGPFGACIVKKGTVLSVARNTVLVNDATCHAEINAIKIASQEIGSYDLSGSVIYSTTEPCPMCFSAIHWAKIDKIIYGTAIGDVVELGFNELNISNEQMKFMGKTSIEILKNFMYEDCFRLLKDWKGLKNKKAY